MKNVKFALTIGLMLAVSFTPALAQGPYFDAGLGIGGGANKLDNKDVANLVRSLGENIHSEGMYDFGLKLGYGPIAGKPIYVVGVFNMIEHIIFCYNETIMGNNSGCVETTSFLMGPGIILYPISLVQLGLSVGVSRVTNQTDLPIEMYDGDGGFAWDISMAVDLGGKNHACLLGIKYSNASNNLKVSSVKQETSAISIFIRYAFRYKNN